MSKIKEVSRGTTQSEAAKLFGVSQSRLNDLLRGRIDKFSLDALVVMLSKAGMHIELRIKAASRSELLDGCTAGRQLFSRAPDNTLIYVPALHISLLDDCLIGNKKPDTVLLFNPAGYVYQVQRCRGREENLLPFSAAGSS